MAHAEDACRWYEKRFRIATFFSDQKSRGLRMHKSHISDVQRLSRLFIAACLAYMLICGLYIEVPDVKRVGGDPSFIVENAAM
jgi:hypothetical protein